ncbi:hypothetical protein [Citrobacter portucalensis]|uniref:hypothetical protein n=1 Tax=Citrobacter portucalensis TaxID=1639133 RepID=UPI0018A40EAD|nr:hypothetical protein [Citrobacter portucalensis]BBV41349.1 hypothetical protein STW0522CIT26_28210 [Citrobacter portucalensis]BBV46330.1 hypothetical protein STW0522CIT27_27700 [Citrobacter portucalensis]BBV51612.1 hypothetical protein STW0522CIT30_28720 [Citrobacter portucalensis]BBW12344.1 hypothetical protein STN0717CIT27_28200 [Citrobacter portucalensis]BBW17396.1 hypothetical protein STN0717CIT36_28200 [Citrobacter portucalensis]
MHISDDLVPGAATLTGAVLVYVEQGCVRGGYVLRADEFVTSLTLLEETIKLAGLSPGAFSRSQTDL